MKAKLAQLVKKSGTLGIVAAVIAFGLLLLCIPTGGEKSGADPPPQTALTQNAFDLAATEARIESALSLVAGAGRVTVILTLKSDGYTEIASDKTYSTREANGVKDVDQSVSPVLAPDGQSKQSPIITRRGYPEFQGALVVAEGAADATVKLELTLAVASLTGLGTEKITVAKMKPNSN